MPVAVVQVRHVWMVVQEGDMPVWVRMGLKHGSGAGVLMPVMLVVHVRVVVLQFLVRVYMTMALA